MDIRSVHWYYIGNVNMYIHTYSEMIFILEGNPTVHKIIDEGRGHYAKEWNQTEKDKHCMVSLTCGF